MGGGRRRDGTTACLLAVCSAFPFTIIILRFAYWNWQLGRGYRDKPASTAKEKGFSKEFQSPFSWVLSWYTKKYRMNSWNGRIANHFYPKMVHEHAQSENIYTWMIGSKINITRSSHAAASFFLARALPADPAHPPYFLPVNSRTPRPAFISSLPFKSWRLCPSVETTQTLPVLWLSVQILDEPSMPGGRVQGGLWDW